MIRYALREQGIPEDEWPDYIERPENSPFPLVDGSFLQELGGDYYFGFFTDWRGVPLDFRGKRTGCCGSFVPWAFAVGSAIRPTCGSLLACSEAAVFPFNIRLGGLKAA